MLERGCSACQESRPYRYWLPFVWRARSRLGHGIHSPYLYLLVRGALMPVVGFGGGGQARRAHLLESTIREEGARFLRLSPREWAPVMVDDQLVGLPSGSLLMLEGVRSSKSAWERWQRYWESDRVTVAMDCWKYGLVVVREGMARYRFGVRSWPF